jgi:hypothetical protein
MRPVKCVLLCILAVFYCRADDDRPKFTPDGRLQRPENYREWVWLSAGLGMSYGPSTPSNAASDPPFDNVFVNRPAYREFLKTGTWPENTIFVLEIRKSASKGSINQGGHFQGELIAVEAEVKNGKWTFYGFEGSAPSATAIPATASCYSCHAEHGAVDNTFVQFYPTLMEVARQKGTFRQR